MSYDQTKVAFIDTETLGLDPEAHPIWEIAVIVDGVEWCWQQIVPGQMLNRADPEALKINGFHDRYDEEHAISRGESVAKFDALVADRHLVGSNPAFDASRIQAGLRQWWGASPRWHYRMRDINSMMHGFFIGRGEIIPEVEPPFSSTALSEALGVDPAQFEPKHTALADARWAKAVYETMHGPPR